MGQAVGRLSARGPPVHRLIRLAIVAVVLAMTLVWSAPSSVSANIGGAATTTPPTVASAAVAAMPAPAPDPVAPRAATVANASVPSGMTLSIESIPSAICVNDTVACNANVAQSQVTLRAQAPNYTVEEWPPVQVAFVIETTPYDGVYDPTGGEATPDPGLDECGLKDPGTSTLCEESNGVPFFVANAQEIANAIATANPHTNVSFAMVDYFATLDQTDDDDGLEYHVDIPQFVPTASFGKQVNSTFVKNVLTKDPPSGYVYTDSDLSDNILDSSSITALYGTIIGSGLNWSEATHHVIVWMGSTAPRDPGFPVDYSVSPSDHTRATAPTCEPSYTQFGDGVDSPNCEGWIDPHDGSHSDSIADLAHKASTCVDSIEKVCTIDAIDLYTTPTDPSSAGWPCTAALRSGGGCPDGSIVEENTISVLDAGCDIAAATDGTWSGPRYFTCPNGTKGDLALTTIGPYASTPNTENPTLLKAFEEIGFGPQVNPVVANGTVRPMFQFVPYGAIRLVPGGPFQSHCTREIPVEKWNCNPDPVVTIFGGTPVYGWNWSNTPSDNYLLLGDIWSVSFLIYASSGPFGPVPVDACTVGGCDVEHGNLTGGLSSWATYLAPGNHGRVTDSFPLSDVDVLPNRAPPPLPSASPGLAPTPGVPPTSPGIGIPVSGPVIVPTPVGAVPVQIALLGLVAAGFTRLSVRNRSVAMPVAIRAHRRPPTRSMFERDDVERGPPLGRFE